MQIKAVLQEEKVEGQLFEYNQISVDFQMKVSKITKYLKTQQNTQKPVKEKLVIVI